MIEEPTRRFHWCRVLPIADYYASPDGDTLLHVERDESGMATLVDPATGHHTPLVFAGMAHFEERVRTEQLRPLYARHDTMGTRGPRASSSEASPAGLVEVTDGAYVWTVEHDHLGKTRLLDRDLDRRVTAATVQQDAILAVATDDLDRQAAAQVLRAVQKWLDERRADFAETRAHLRFRPPGDPFEYHRLSDAQCSSLAEFVRLRVRLTDRHAAILDIFSKHAELDDAGAIRVAIEETAVKRDTPGYAIGRARELKLDTVPFFSEAMDADLRALLRHGKALHGALQHSGEGTSVIELARRLSRLHARLFEHGCGYEASVLGAAAAALLIDLPTETREQHKALWEAFRLDEIPAPTEHLDFMLSAIVDRLGLETSATLADVLIAVNKSNAEPVAEALDELRLSARAMHSPCVARALWVTQDEISRVHSPRLRIPGPRASEGHDDAVEPTASLVRRMRKPELGLLEQERKPVVLDTLGRPVQDEGAAAFTTETVFNRPRPRKPRQPAKQTTPDGGPPS